MARGKLKQRNKKEGQCCSKALVESSLAQACMQQVEVQRSGFQGHTQAHSFVQNRQVAQEDVQSKEAEDQP